MNQSHRSLFNAALGAWVAVPEHSRARASRATSSRRATRTATVATTVATTVAAAVAASFLLTPLQQAIAQAQPVAAGTLPTGQTIRSGTASFSTTGNVLEVSQQSARLQTDWTSFSIGRDATVKFVQPSATAVALNRVTGADGSQILGRLESNGQVFLVNPNGVLFGNGAQVAVGSLVASTLDLSDANFRAGVNSFSGTSTAAVENQGSLSAASGGAIALIAARVVNGGTISAPQGNALLGAGNGVTLDFGGPVRLRVTQAAVQAQVDNGGVVAANGGQVMLSAQGASDLASAAINQRGTLEASQLEEGAGGRIVLSTNGRFTQTGNMAANAKDGAGGTIDVSAGGVTLQGNAHAASTNGRGGHIQITSGNDPLVLGSPIGSARLASLDVGGQTAGGSIDLVANRGLVAANTSLVANSDQGGGGQIRMTSGSSSRAILQTNTVQANGDSGGGRLEISGGGVDLLQSSVQLNATRRGNGGVLSINSVGNLRLDVASSVSANGAGQTGNGGEVTARSGSLDNSLIGLPVSVLAGDRTLRSSSNGSILVQSSNIGIDDVITPTTVAGWLDGGAHVTLMADNDLTVSQALTTQSASSGALALVAGRSVLMNASINRASGDVSLMANASVDDGIRNASRSAGAANLTMANATAITAPSVDLSIGDGAGVTASQSGTLTLGSVTARELLVSAPSVTASFQANGKVYDGTTNASGGTWTATGLGFTTGSNLRLTGSDYRFADRNAGVNKTVTATAELTGFDGTSTTTIDTPSGDLQGTGTATIQQRTLTATATAQNKGYDGTTQATLGSLEIAPLGTDRVSVTASGVNFADKNVGLSKQVNVTGLTLSGADSGNYLLASTGITTSAAISQRVLLISISALDKVYDGQVTAQVSTSDNRVTGDVLTVSPMFTSFADKNAGTGKIVTAIGFDLSGQDARNYGLAQSVASTTATITPRLVTPTAVASNKVYDGSTAASVTLTSDALAGDVLSVRSNSAQFVDKQVGVNKAVQVTGLYLDGNDRANYVLSQLTAQSQANIDPRVLNATVTANSKVYDGNTQARIASVSSDKLAGDDVTVSTGSARFADKNAGTNKTVTIDGLALNGADKGNYVLGAATTTTQADITARTLNLITQAQNKVYDGTTTAVVSVADDRIAGDVLQVNHQAANFADRQAGREKRVLITGIALTGADKDNYVVAANAVDQADITPRPLTPTVAASNKVYDGNTVASVTLGGDVLAGDVVSVRSTAANFADKNAGVNKTVQVSGLYLDGLDRGNYVLSQLTAQSQANIDPRVLNAAVSAQNKVYDGTSQAQIASVSTDKLAGDDVTVNTRQAQFSDKNVGINRAVTVSNMTLTGADRGNYVLGATTATTQADITARSLNLIARAQNKVYDGNTTAIVDLTDDRIAGDVLQVNHQSANFADRLAGREKRVLIDGIGLTGADKDNYVVVSSAVDHADITPRTLNVVVHAQNKVYDGQVRADVSLSDDRVQGDLLTVDNRGASFDNKNAGVGKAVTVQGVSISGADQDNYRVALTTVQGTADITPRTLQVAAAASDKVYDGQVRATLNGLTDDRVSGDTLQVSADDARFADKQVGVRKQVTVSGLNLSGVDAGNYRVQQDPITTTASISARQLQVQATVNGKVYDGQVGTTVRGLTDDRVAGDDLVLSASGANFDDKNVGIGKNATVQGLQVAGADSLNYVLQAQPVVAQADVTPRLLTVRATAQDKVYDSLTTAKTALQDDRVQGDQLVVNQTSANFSDKRAGRNKTVTVAGLSLSGTDGGNYQLAQSQVATQASITPRPIAVTVVPVQKDEDGTGLATVSVTTAPLPGDQAGAQWTGARFDNERPGVNKQVTVSGISLVGPDADNYELARTVETVGGGVIRPQQVLQGVQSGCSASGAAATCSAGTWLLDLNLASQSLIGTQGSLSLEDIDPTTGRPRPVTDGRDGAEGRLPKRLKQQGDGIQLPLEAKQNRP